MIKLAITGEMGSGKSYCSKIFESLGVPVFYTDDVARMLLNQDSKLKKEITREFGHIYVDGKVEPKLLREIVFVDGGEEKLKILNEISHPYVLREYDMFCDAFGSKTYTLAETALLFEVNMHRIVDKTIYVCVEEELRIKRTFDRSGFSREDYKSRMKNQVPSELKLKLCDYVIYNNEGDDVNEQILKIHKELI
jgi:dephospho-CoA kinase